MPSAALQLAPDTANAAPFRPLAPPMVRSQRAGFERNTGVKLSVRPAEKANGLSAVCFYLGEEALAEIGAKFGDHVAVLVRVDGEDVAVWLKKGRRGDAGTKTLCQSKGSRSRSGFVIVRAHAGLTASPSTAQPFHPARGLAGGGLIVRPEGEARNAVLALARLGAPA